MADMTLPTVRTPIYSKSSFYITRWVAQSLRTWAFIGQPACESALLDARRNGAWGDPRGHSDLAGGSS